MKLIKFLSILSLVLSCMLVKADIVENKLETAKIDVALPGNELADLSTGGMMTNRHGTSTIPTPVSPTIPEPASALLLGLSLVGAAMFSRRRKSVQA
jgi:hypothetical protein